MAAWWYAGFVERAHNPLLLLNAALGLMQVVGYVRRKVSDGRATA